MATPTVHAGDQTAEPRTGRRATRRWFDRSLGRSGLAIVAVLIAAVNGLPYLAPYVGPWPADPFDPVNFGFRLIAHLLWGAAALLALSRASTVRLGWLLVLLAAADLIWAIQFVAISALYFISNAYLGLGSVILAHVLVAFPSGTLTSRFDRRLVGGLYLYFAVGGVVRLLIWEPAFVCDLAEYCPRNQFALLPDAGATTAFDALSALLVPTIGVLVLVAVVRHWRAAGAPARRVLLPVVVAFPFVFLYNTLWYAAWNLDLEPLQDLVTLPIANVSGWILPGAFLLGVLRARAVRTALPAAVVELGSLPTSVDLESVLRRRLGDPGLRVVRWSRSQGAYLDNDGHPVEQPSADGTVRLVTLERGGEPVAGVILDAALDDPGLAATLTSLIDLTVQATDLRDELRAHGGDVAGLPSGELTFLFGDVEGSTALLESLGERYADLLSELRRLVGEVIDRHGGRVVDARADEVFAVFPSATGAAAAALELGDRMATAAWPEGSTVRMRIGLHTGRPELTPSGYVGLDVHRAARVMAAAHGGQVVATTAVVEALGASEGLTVRPLGRFSLRGLSEPTAIVQLDRAGAPASFPPLRAEPVG